MGSTPSSLLIFRDTLVQTVESPKGLPQAGTKANQTFPRGTAPRGSRLQPPAASEAAHCRIVMAKGRRPDGQPSMRLPSHERQDRWWSRTTRSCRHKVLLSKSGPESIEKTLDRRTGPILATSGKRGCTHWAASKMRLRWNLNVLSLYQGEV